MGAGRKNQTIKQTRKKNQVKKKARIKRKIAAAKK